MNYLFLAPWFVAGLVMIWFSVSEHAWAQTARAIWRSAKRPGPRYATRLGLAMCGLSGVLGSVAIVGLIYFDPTERHPGWYGWAILGGNFGPLLVWVLVDGSRRKRA